MDRSLTTLYLSYPISWLITLSANVICFIFFFRAWKKRVAPAAAAE